jgi:hypothetical protein
MNTTALAIPCIAAVLSMAANADSPENNATMSQTTSELEVLEVIRNFNRAFANNDPDKYFAYIGRDITVITPSNP